MTVFSYVTLRQRCTRAFMKHALMKCLYPIEDRKLMEFVRLNLAHNLITQEETEHLEHVCMMYEPCDRARHSVARELNFIEKYAGCPFKGTFGIYYSKPIAYFG